MAAGSTVGNGAIRMIPRARHDQLSAHASRAFSPPRNYCLDMATERGRQCGGYMRQEAGDKRRPTLRNEGPQPGMGYIIMATARHNRSSSSPLSLDDLFDAELGASVSQVPSKNFPESADSPVSPASADSASSTPSADSAGSGDSPDSPEAAGSVGSAGSADSSHSAPSAGSPDEDPYADEEDDVEMNREEADPEDLSENNDSDDSSDDEIAISPAEPTFADLGLPADLLRAVTDMGFETPTAIQREAIPVLLAGQDVVGVAQTGTGKTAAFGLPLLDAVDAKDGRVQAIALAPTRELALQSAEALTDMASRSRGLDIVAVYGGAPYGPQIGALKAGAQVVVGTPGRIIDLIDKGALSLEAVRYFVLDEADEMLRMGFAEDVDTIAETIPEDRRTALFSATMPPAIEDVARRHLHNPVRIAVSRQSSTVDTVHQAYAVVPFRHKIGAVSRVLAVTEAEAAIVFVRTKSTAEDVAIELAGRGIQAAAISGDVPQRERERLVERLRAGTLDVLVATDVAARGLDVDRIGLVVNFDVPREAEAYVHRIGRTGRAGRSGEAITFLTPKEKGKLRQIERLTGTRLEEITLPSPADVSRHRAVKLLAKAEQRHERGRLELYRELIASAVTEQGVELEELTATLLALSVGDAGPKTWQERREEPRTKIRREVMVDEEGTFLSATFEGGRDKPRRERPEGKPGAARGGRRAEEGTGTTYRVEVGHRDRVLPGAIVGAIANEAGISGSDIGRIDILQSFSLVEVHTPLSQEQLEVLKHATFGGRELRMRVDQGPGGGWDNDDNPPSRQERGRAGRLQGRGGFRGDRNGGRSGFRNDREGRDFRGERGHFRRDDRSKRGQHNDRGGFRKDRDDERGYQGERRKSGLRRDERDNTRGFRQDRGFNRDGERSVRGNREKDRGNYRTNDRGHHRDGGRSDYRGSHNGSRGERDNSRSGFGGNRSQGGYRSGNGNRGGYSGRNKRG